MGAPGGSLRTCSPADNKIASLACSRRSRSASLSFFTGSSSSLSSEEKYERTSSSEELSPDSSIASDGVGGRSESLPGLSPINCEVGGGTSGISLLIRTSGACRDSAFEAVSRERDAKATMTYMEACMQYKGKIEQLIQPVKHKWEDRYSAESIELYGAKD